MTDKHTEQQTQEKTKSQTKPKEQPKTLGDYLASIGGFSLILWLGSMVLYYTSYEITFLMWIETRGNDIARMIRIAFTLVGAALIGLGTHMKNKEAENKTMPQ